MYDNSTVAPVGQCTLLCQRDSRVHKIDFQVTDTLGKSPIISGSDSIRLKLVDMHIDEICISQLVSSFHSQKGGSLTVSVMSSRA